MGTEGQVARSLREVAVNVPDVKVGCGGRPDIDLLRPDSIDRALFAFSPDIVINPAAYTAVDLNASYALKSSLGTTSIVVGVRNLFNAIPPAVYSSFLTYTDPSYDFVGRYFWGRIAQRF